MCGHRPWLGDYEECEETPEIILKQQITASYRICSYNSSLAR